MVRLQTNANDFLAKRFHRNQRDNGNAIPDCPGSTDSSEHGIDLSTSSLSATALQRRMAGKVGGCIGARSVVGDALEQAELLRLELDRVKAGLTLLTQSVEKLNDVVQVDTRCCSGFLETLCYSFWPASTSSSYQGSGYDRVGTDESAQPLTSEQFPSKVTKHSILVSRNEVDEKLSISL